MCEKSEPPISIKSVHKIPQNGSKHTIFIFYGQPAGHAELSRIASGPALRPRLSSSSSTALVASQPRVRMYKTWTENMNVCKNKKCYLIYTAPSCNCNCNISTPEMMMSKYCQISIIWKCSIHYSVIPTFAPSPADLQMYLNSPSPPLLRGRVGDVEMCRRWYLVRGDHNCNYPQCKSDVLSSFRHKTF